MHIFHHQQALCQTCSDKRRVQHAVNDAQRITYRLREMMDSKETISCDRTVRERLFYNSAHCSLTGNSCSNFFQYEQELRLVELELEEVFSAFQEELLKLEEEEACSKKWRAFDLLRGHYPQAASLMQI